MLRAVRENSVVVSFRGSDKHRKQLPQKTTPTKQVGVGEIPFYNEGAN